MYSLFWEFDESGNYYAQKNWPELVHRLRAWCNASLLRQAQVWLVLISRACVRLFTLSLFIKLEENNKPGKFFFLNILSFFFDSSFMIVRTLQSSFIVLRLKALLMCLVCCYLLIAFLKIHAVMNINCLTSIHYIQEAVTIVQDIKDAEAASRKLIEEAYSRGSSDNITCVVVRFESTWMDLLRSAYLSFTYKHKEKPKRRETFSSLFCNRLEH